MNKEIIGRIKDPRLAIDKREGDVIFTIPEGTKPWRVADLCVGLGSERYKDMCAPVTDVVCRNVYFAKPWFLKNLTGATPNVRTAIFTCCVVAPQDFRFISECWRRLGTLILEEVSIIDDEAMRAIGTMTSLVALVLSRTPNLNDAALCHLEGLSLKALDLGFGPMLTSQAVLYLDKLPTLEYVDLSGLTLRETDTLRVLERLPHLQFVTVSNATGLNADFPQKLIGRNPAVQVVQTSEGPVRRIVPTSAEAA